jgi:hypothetical protein
MFQSFTTAHDIPFYALWSILDVLFDHVSSVGHGGMQPSAWISNLLLLLKTHVQWKSLRRKLKSSLQVHELWGGWWMLTWAWNSLNFSNHSPLDFTMHQEASQTLSSYTSKKLQFFSEQKSYCNSQFIHGFFNVSDNLYNFRRRKRYE